MTSTATASGVRPWAHAAVAAVGTYVLALVVVLPRESEQTDASMAGRLFAYALFGFVAGGFFGSVVKERWRVAASWLAPPLGAALLIAIWLGNDLVEQADERQASEENYARSHLVEEPSVLGWRQVSNPAIRQESETLNDQLAAREPGSSGFVAGYRNGDKAVSVLAVNTDEGSGGLGEELEQSPRKALVNYLGGAGVKEPTPVETSIQGIEFMCAELEDLRTMCAWADLTTIGNASWEVQDIDINRAAALTERLLEEIRVVDEPPG